MNMLLLSSPLIRTISVLLLLLSLVPGYISAASLHSNLNSDYYLTDGDVRSYLDNTLAKNTYASQQEKNNYYKSYSLPSKESYNRAARLRELLAQLEDDDNSDYFYTSYDDDSEVQQYYDVAEFSPRGVPDKRGVFRYGRRR